MDWFFENLGKVVTFIIFIFYILGSLRGASGKEDEEDPEAIERARKVQEEIRRKILERQRQGQGSAPELAEERQGHYRPRPDAEATPYPLYEDEDEGVSPLRPEPSPRPAVEQPTAPQVPAMPPPLSRYDDTFAAQRRAIEEQLRKAESLRQEALRKTPSGGRGLNRATAFSVSAASNAPALDLRSDVRVRLSDRQSLRSAIVLSEILDKPVSLR